MKGRQELVVPEALAKEADADSLQTSGDFISVILL